jgi:hypothetical protein
VHVKEGEIYFKRSYNHFIIERKICTNLLNMSAIDALLLTLSITLAFLLDETNVVSHFRNGSHVKWGDPHKFHQTKERVLKKYYSENFPSISLNSK